ncbi:MAG: hypothetical protein KJ077_10650 [Anaerolineae bacterium]|nr:hypothetical protein [Anaerolineae bacterium]
MSETREQYNAGGVSATPRRMSQLSSEAISWEMLNAMDDHALVKVYRLLVELKQQDAADLLAEYARRVIELDVTRTEGE